MGGIARVLAGIGAFAAVGLAGLVAFFASGGYGIGADAPHSPLVFAILDAVRRRSVDVQSRAVVVPDLDAASMVAAGAEHYAAMCSGCHLAPGIEDSEIRPGLYPQPPKLADAGPRDPRQTFWVIKHGIKMSGMPAWGATHDDGAIWAMVAFLRELPGMSAAQYRALSVAADVGEHDHGDRHDHAHDHAHEHPPGDDDSGSPAAGRPAH